MPHYNYLIIGGGMTADAAAQGIRDVDFEGSIGIISAETVPPYNRPPLTKGLWKGDSIDSIWRTTAEKGVELHLDCRVTSISPRNRRVVDDRQTIYSYDKLLLATGGRPRLLPFGDGQVIYYRTSADYQHLRQLTKQANRFAVVGGGFIGSEIAAALCLNHKEVTMIFPGTTVGGRLFPHDVGDYLNDYFRQHGVTVLTNETVINGQWHGDTAVIQTRSGREIEVDGVVAGIGIEPNTELAHQAGLHVENGIIVDEFLRTNNSDIYAAGDVAAFFNPALGRVVRVEHEDNANMMGMAAGRNMAGAFDPYHHLPFFYSDLFDVSYEAIGDLDARLEIVADWKHPYRQGVVYYLYDGMVRGVLLWNVQGQVDSARRLISEGGIFVNDDLRGKLPSDLIEMTHA